DRHGMAATAILDWAATRAIGKVPLTYHIGFDTLSPSANLTRAMENFDVLSQSSFPILLPKWRYNAFAAIGDMNKTRALISMAAPNNDFCQNGQRMPPPRNVTLASATTLSPYLIRVGVLGNKGNVASYSDSNFPDLVFSNPFFESFSYRMYYKPKEYEKLYSHMLSWHAIMPTPQQYVRLLHADRINPGKPQTGWLGTSFAAPYLAGDTAYGPNRYPNLGPTDFWAAALTATRPVDQVACPDHTFLAIHYVQNPRGLPYNFADAGYGAFDPALYRENLARLDVLRRRELTTKPVLQIVKGTFNAWSRHHIISFKVPDDFLVTRVLVVVKFDSLKMSDAEVQDHQFNAPYILRDPQNHRAINLASAMYAPDDGTYPTQRVFTTSFFLGDKATRGTWIFGPDFKLDSRLHVTKATLVLYGAERGGRIEKYFDGFHAKPPNETVTASLPKRIAAESVPPAP
ncbi:MAG TPA: hypothetical protein VMV79_07090, partial [Alphaproteobacteria bacterium]|nr:hypothetical protein [Alphaproteobacteria bacterium]